MNSECHVAGSVRKAHRLAAGLARARRGDSQARCARRAPDPDLIRSSTTAVNNAPTNMIREA